MKYLSFALVLIYVMWLIDKHNEWKRAAKIVLSLTGLAVLGLCAVYGWAFFQDYQDRKKAAAIEAVQRQAAVQSCVQRFKNVNMDSVGCETDPSLQPQVTPPALPAGAWSDVPPKDAWAKFKPAKNKKIKNTSIFTADMTMTEGGSVKCGTIVPGEQVMLLDVDVDSGWLKVKNAKGTIGWAFAGVFTVVE